MNEQAPPLMVVGCGTMGGGIAQVAALSGCNVTLYDASAGVAEKCRERIGTALQKEVEQQRLTAEQRASALKRVQVTNCLTAAREADIVIEAVRELLEVKQEIFRELESHARPEALLLSNTSMISITRIAENLQHPERVAGCHFFNPVPRMELVEVIPGEKTAQATLDKVTALVTKFGKVAVPAPNSPGFIVNRALLMLLNEAAFLVQEGTAPAHVDAAMKLGCNFPMGPVELMDLIGIDVVRDCMIALWEQFGRASKYEPSALLHQLVEQGKLGRKSGEGFYKY